MVRAPRPDQPAIWASDLHVDGTIDLYYGELAGPAGWHWEVIWPGYR